MLYQQTSNSYIVAVMISHKDIEKRLLSYDGAFLDYPFGEGVAVYKVPVGESSKMFALVSEGKVPVRLSLKCDPGLSQYLREKYEEVMPGYHLNKKHWNTIILSGQLSNQEIYDLVAHSHNLVIGEDEDQDQNASVSQWQQDYS